MTALTVQMLKTVQFVVMQTTERRMEIGARAQTGTLTTTQTQLAFLVPMTAQPVKMLRTVQLAVEQTTEWRMDRGASAWRGTLTTERTQLA